MKKTILCIILALFLAISSFGQILRNIKFYKTYEDSNAVIYSVKMTLDKHVNNSEGLKILRIQLKHCLKISDKDILNIETLGSKKYREFNYKIKVAK